MSLVKIIIVIILLFSYIYTVLATRDVSKRERFLCTSAKCIMKCCPLEKYIVTTMQAGLPNDIETPGQTLSCKPFKNIKRQFSTLITDSHISFNRSASLKFEVKAGVFEGNKTFKNLCRNLNMPFLKMYVNEYPELILEEPNVYDRWTRVPNMEFCWDYQINLGKSRIDGGIWGILKTKRDKSRQNESNKTFQNYGMVVSCILLGLVLVVYVMLPDLRNLPGLILMANLTSFLLAYLLLVVMRFQPPELSTCRILTYMIYYWFLASFCWANVMSYNMWRTFRRYAKSLPNHRSERFKLLMYCMYAFGVPLVMTIFLVTLNSVDMTHLPWFVTPQIGAQHGCFLSGGQKLLYLYVPMMILMVCNWVFYLMTAFHVSRLYRGSSVLHSHRKQPHNFMVYVKLSVVMGLDWVLEFVSYLSNDAIWMISDWYHIFIGVPIFLVFVCKPKILRNLMERFMELKQERGN